ncbi:alpha/beta hydrolase [Exilibacterium tricleocarpae]|uniref:alpha/beta hydrolase n=1 Tax=Exilibacterium tricleocarpae TaxID=2591008 RepID=UPI0015D12A10|nr:CocE/NonD family hydrolase [Exilibacterium tricleocarpae]
MEKVSFNIDGTPLVGDLYKPASTGKAPAVAIIGPMTYHKEQAPTEYAKRLADRGFIALAYDSRYRGESGGEPREWENPAHKVADLKAAVNYLKSRDDVESGQVSILAICQGSSEAVKAAGELPDLHALATLAGHYRDAEGDFEWLTEDGYAARKAAGEAAAKKYADTGKVDYVKASDPVDVNVGMPGDFVFAWYGPWADRGIWKNRYAVMSDADLLSFESISAVPNIKAPWLMIHGDNCFLPSAAKRHIGAIAPTTKHEVVWNDTPHLSYYDQPDVLEEAADRISKWFNNANTSNHSGLGAA